MSKRHQALIFDLDGIVVDSERIELEMRRQPFKDHGLDFDLETYLTTIGSSVRFEHLPEVKELIHIGKWESIDQMSLETRARSRAATIKEGLMAGVRDAMDWAKAHGVRLGLGSSSANKWVLPVLEGVGILHEFEAVVTSDDVPVGKAKPAPDIFLKVLELLDTQPEDALVLEDSYNGVQAACAAGIRVVAIPNAVTHVQDFSKATEIIPSMRELELEKYFPQAVKQ